MPPTAVGVDIGTRTLTVAEVQARRDGPTVTNFGGVELPAGAVRAGEVVDAEAAAGTLRELLDSVGVRPRKVWLGVANQRVVVRRLEVPWMSERELRAGLRFQVQDHIPIPVEEAELDVHLVEERYTDDGDRLQRLLLVAAHRDMVAATVEVATLAGLKPVGVDLNPLAVLRAVGSTAPLDTAEQLVVDVGAGITAVTAHLDGTPSFVRIMATGGDDITGALAEELSIELEEAEAVKLQATTEGEGTAADHVIAERADAFVGEIRNSVQYFRSQHAGSQLAEVVLTGGGSQLPGLAPRLADGLQLPVELGDPFRYYPAVDTVYGEPELRRVGPSLTTAIGLALGGLE